MNRKKNYSTFYEDPFDLPPLFGPPPQKKKPIEQ
jgi:hypothetical protein